MSNKESKKGDMEDREKHWGRCRGRARLRVCSSPRVSLACACGGVYGTQARRWRACWACRTAAGPSRRSPSLSWTATWTRTQTWVQLCYRSSQLTSRSSNSQRPLVLWTGPWARTQTWVQWCICVSGTEILGMTFGRAHGLARASLGRRGAATSCRAGPCARQARHDPFRSDVLSQQHAPSNTLLRLLKERKTYARCQACVFACWRLCAPGAGHRARLARPGRVWAGHCARRRRRPLPRVRFGHALHTYYLLWQLDA